ncbi:acyl-CoA/acyl-ACP dehydrogenase [Thermoleophilia bacterium SCSIO 60948]|nr:acyl-CoA/acyl-ACP dehydrogenase [Thermoleophilia bacterium SCSIO 60948]
MDFDLNDEQREIKNTARELLAARLGPARVRELAEAGDYDDGVWGEISELGWPGIAIGEEHGGLGLGLVELAIVCEELGYACAPTPFLSNAAAGVTVAVAGSEAQQADRLPGIAAGSALGACASGPGSTLVTDADRAAVVAVEIDGTPVLVDREDARVERLDLIDRTRSYCTVTTAAQGEPLTGPIEPATDRIAVLLSAELVGIAQRAMEMAVAYAKERQQFGRAIGSFQAVSHRCAEMLLEVEEARSLTLSAAWTADAEPDELSLAASMAKARASEAAWRVCTSSLQVHGGIGFTWEHDLQFWLKRATLDAKLFGSASVHRERVAALSGLG